MLLQRKNVQGLARRTSMSSAPALSYRCKNFHNAGRTELIRAHSSTEVGVNPFSASTTETSTTSTNAASSSPQNEYEWTTHTWKWRGYTIHYKTAGCGEPLVLVHGFGLSSFHYRRNIPVLAKDYKVYALDLLGFGRSSKPILQYSMELWRDLLVDFTSEFLTGKKVVLVGNSIGALACLMANAALPDESVRGTVLLNSAGAMNNKGVIGDWRILALYPLLLFIDFLLSIPAVSASLFNNFRTKDNIKQVLRNGVYSNPDNVDQALVDEIYAPSCDPGAREVFVSVITGPPGPKPWSLMPDVKGPLLVLWGDKDTLTPADGPVGRFLQALQGSRPDTTFKMLSGVGHCLHDDKPELVHAELLPWLQRITAGEAKADGDVTTVQQQEAAVETAVVAAGLLAEAVAETAALSAQEPLEASPVLAEALQTVASAADPEEPAADTSDGAVPEAKEVAAEVVAVE